MRARGQSGPWGAGRAVTGLLAAVAVLGSTVLPAGAGAARAHRGNLVVSFEAAFSPQRLPRDRPAPISVTFSGGVSTQDGSALPRLRRIEVGLAGGSRIDVSGLPICPRGRLRDATARQALRRCPGAVVGHGFLSSEVYLPHQAPFSTRAELIAFNGRVRGGRPAVWVQAFSPGPPASFVLPFSIRTGPGIFPTQLLAEVPRSLGPWPHLSAFQITFSRRFVQAGERHSYLNASCPVPPRFTGGTLPFAKASYFFAGAPELAATVVRACHVR